jgi:nicotinamidase-related amidase
MRLTAHFYRYYDADLTAEVPADALLGWDTKTLEVPQNESALACMHFWNFGLDERLPYAPDAPWAGWYRVQEYFSRAIPITRDVMPPLLRAARAHGLGVIHVGSGSHILKYPGFAMARDLAGDDPPRPEGAPSSTARDAWFKERNRDLYGPHNPPNVTYDFAPVDFPPQVKPLDSEPIVVSTHQLNAVCRQRGIWHLIYCGFCVNSCIEDSPGGMVDMRRLGYACSILRDATTAAEYRETARHELCKQVAFCKVSLGSGYVFDSADLIAALEDEPAT